MFVDDNQSVDVLSLHISRCIDQRLLRVNCLWSAAHMLANKVIIDMLHVIWPRSFGTS